MSKKNKVMIAIVATLIIMGIGVMTALSITDVNGVKIDGQTSQMMLITVTVSGIVGVIVGALFNKLFIWLSQLGQEEKQSVSFLTSWYATAISQIPFAIINIFLVTVLSLYKSGNTVAAIISGVVNALIYTFILRQENVITKRTQIIYLVIMVVLIIAISAVPMLMK
ncbi:MFS transporter [Leuconostoc gelidum]|uniref:MFS transporter n=1 Tax=Leuconostoc gelidum TaxID=1244 RepID=UPI001C7CFAA2|nr:MFS transporter [Leuconostoc gelidum]MBZ6009223.1 MFS transporter [Leuconostoc gelidum subsp. aenigmaticum]MBZ6009951.1 MFS transporter [Leuconostoc gelidum subsp. aenigmaticum]